MTIIEKKSNRKKKAIFDLVKKGEYSISYALMLVEELSDNGKLIETDYEELAEYLETLLNEETIQEEVGNIEETEETEENGNEEEAE